MKKIIFSILLGVILLSGKVYAQGVEKYNETHLATNIGSKSQANNTDIKNYYSNYQFSLSKEYDGTYQFIISNNYKLLITNETLDFIAKNRAKGQEVIINLNESVKVKILSEKTIKSKKFIPITELFIIE